MIGQPGCHRRCTRPPQLRRATAIGRLGHPQRLAQARMWQDKVVVGVEQRPILGHDQSSTLLYGNERLPTISLTLALPDGRSVDLGQAPVTDQQGPE